MSSDTKGAGIKDDYAQQIAGDLSANQAAQERVRSELHRLQEELSQLEDNSKILVKMQDALGITAKPAPAPAAKRGAKHSAERGAERAVVPAARSASPAGQKTAAAAKPATTTPAKISRAGKAAGKTAAAKKDAVGPSWLELVTAVFTGQSEPRSAAEVTESITTAHPERKVQAAVIRNTLEQGVARGLLERSKQGRSVYYLPTTSPTSPASPASPASDTAASAPAGPLS
ncbi:hypothetical protein [Streptomyces sp. NPDC054849]